MSSTPDLIDARLRIRVRLFADTPLGQLLRATPEDEWPNVLLIYAGLGAQRAADPGVAGALAAQMLARLDEIAALLREGGAAGQLFRAAGPAPSTGAPPPFPAAPAEAPPSASFAPKLKGAAASVLSTFAPKPAQ